MKNGNYILVVFYLIFLLTPSSIFSQDIRFEHFSTEESVNSPSVTNIAQDQEGFMWFTTVNGVAKYDGYKFKTYMHDPADSNSISFPYVWKVYVDREGIIWFGVSLGGLNKFNPKTEQFTHYRHDPDNPNSLSNDEALEIYEDKNGLFWVGTYGGGLNRFGREKEKFIHFRHDPENQNSLSHDRVHDLRHTALTHIVDQSRDIISAKDIAGHSNISVTEIYTHGMPEKLRRAIEKLPY